MRHRSMLTLFTISFSALTAQANILEDSKLQGKFSLYANSVESSKTNGKLTGTNIELSMEQELSEELSYAVRGGLTLETGSHKALNSDEFAPKQSAFLSEALVEYRPFGFLNLKLGAINQEAFESPLLLTDTPFAGISQEASAHWGKTFIFVQAQQAMPSNQDINQRLGVVQEGTPTLLMHTLGLKGQTSGHKFQASVSHFHFNDLSSSVAQQSLFMGNSVSGTGENAKFVYDFHGLNIAASAALSLGKNLDLGLKGQYLFNEGAPDGRNSGHFYGVSLRQGNLEFEALKFRNESDASIGYYNEKWLGHNNREGFAATLRYFIAKQNTEIEMTFINADIIRSSVSQSKQDAALLRLTRRYNVN